ATFEIVIAFWCHSLLKGTLMVQRESAVFTVTPRSVSGLAVIFLVLAAFFALLNGQKVKRLRANVAIPQPSARGQVLAKPNAPTRAASKAANSEDRAAKAEAALAQAEKEKADLQGKLDASQQEIIALRQRAAGTSESAPGSV